MSGKEKPSDTYSVSFGAERIERIRSISDVTGLQQSEILRELWDRRGIEVIGELLEEKEVELGARLDNISSLMDQLKNVTSG